MGRDRSRAGGMAQCRQQESPPVLQLIFETTLLVGPNSGTEHCGSNWTTDIGHRTFETMGQQHNKGYCVHILNELPLALFQLFSGAAGSSLALSWPRKQFDCGEKMKSKSYQLKPVSMSLLTHVYPASPNCQRKYIKHRGRKPDQFL